MVTDQQSTQPTNAEPTNAELVATVISATSAVQDAAAITLNAIEALTLHENSEDAHGGSGDRGLDEHNTDPNAHDDIRNSITANTNAMAAKANKDLDNLSPAGEAKLTGGANTNLSNITQAGKNTSIAWGMPDYDNGVSFDLTLTPYTVPFRGIIKGYIDGPNATSYVRVNGNIVGGSRAYNTALSIEVELGDVVTIDATLEETTVFLYPLKGAI